MEAAIARVADFEVTGDGSAAGWEQAEWFALKPVGKNRSPYATRAKLLYSATGLYAFFDCEDGRLTATETRDFDDLWNEDVVELFLWTDERHPVYFEYEISPLGVELPILVSNNNGTFMGWRPWHYEGERLIQKATAVRGGAKQPLTHVNGWSAEFFVPFALLKGLGNVPPQPGTRWRANLYRIDHDTGTPLYWAWSPISGDTFHVPHEFGTIVFGE
jgi:hypothetical protein